MLALRLLKLLFCLLELHGQKLDLLVAHRDILLRVVSHLHLRLETLLNFALKLLNQSLLLLELRLALLEAVIEHDLVLLLLLILS